MKKSYTILIDSSKQSQTTVTLQLGATEKKKTFVSERHTAQQVLPLLETLLSENSLTFEDITGIDVDTGPGSFTGLRVGATIGNTLGLLLDIPVNGKKGIASIPLDYGVDRWKNDSD
jgi:tRNA threonylcarbamoyladenosine biosynthesis protein TsaB